jgi:hypothetical protein
MIGDDCMHNNHKLNNESLQIYQILPFGARKKKKHSQKGMPVIGNWVNSHPGIEDLR